MPISKKKLKARRSPRKPDWSVVTRSGAVAPGSNEIPADERWSVPTRHVRRVSLIATRVAASLAARDKADSTRAVSPLTLAPDAVYIDTTGVPIADVVAQVLALARARLERVPQP